MPTISVAKAPGGMGLGPDSPVVEGGLGATTRHLDAGRAKDGVAIGRLRHQRDRGHGKERARDETARPHGHRSTVCSSLPDSRICCR